MDQSPLPFALRLAPRLALLPRLAVLPMLVAALVACGDAGASVVRCTAPGGAVTYQNSTCPRGSRTTPVDETANSGVRFAEPKDVDRVRRERAAERARDAASFPSRTRIGADGGSARRKPAKVPYNAAERRFITSGMTTADVRARIGMPDQVVRPSSSSPKPSSKGALQRWVYLPADDDPQTTTILTVRGGLVTEVDRRVSH